MRCVDVCMCVSVRVRVCDGFVNILHYVTYTHLPSHHAPTYTHTPWPLYRYLPVNIVIASQTMSKTDWRNVLHILAGSKERFGKYRINYEADAPGYVAMMMTTMMMCACDVFRYC